MQPLQYLQRANRDHFPPDANLWDINLIFNIEKEVIDKEIIKRAAGNWRQLKDVRQVLAQADSVVAQIESKYDPPDETPDPRIYDEARSGKLELLSPTPQNITTMKIAFLVAILTEFSVMVLQAIFGGDFNPFIVVLAIFLALGGFLQGMGIGNLLTRSWRIATGRILQGESTAAPWLLICIGTALILLIAILRASGSAETFDLGLVFLITLFFGEAVAICEAIKVKQASMRSSLLQEMVQAQHWQANSSHHQHVVGGKYKAQYEAEVKRAESEMSQVSQTPAAARAADSETGQAAASL